MTSNSAVSLLNLFVCTVLFSCPCVKALDLLQNYSLLLVIPLQTVFLKINWISVHSVHVCPLYIHFGWLTVVFFIHDFFFRGLAYSSDPKSHLFKIKVIKLGKKHCRIKTNFVILLWAKRLRAELETVYFPPLVLCVCRFVFLPLVWLSVEDLVPPTWREETLSFLISTNPVRPWWGIMGEGLGLVEKPLNMRHYSCFTVEEECIGWKVRLLSEEISGNRPSLCHE